MQTTIRLTVIMAALFSSMLYASEHFCPPPDLVKKNEKNISAWQHDDLYWSIGHKGWPYAKEIGFMRAIYYPENNKLDCYYRWEDPKQLGTYLWTTVALNPDANTKISVQGANWESSDNLMICKSGRPETCAFEIQ